MSKAMKGSDDRVVERHKAARQLTCLVGVLLKEYTPKVSCDCQLSQMMTHALAEQRLINTFYSTMSIRVGQHQDTTSILNLQMKQRPRWLRLSNELALVVTYGL
jgi:hypothetical protein